MIHGRHWSSHSLSPGPHAVHLWYPRLTHIHTQMSTGGRRATAAGLQTNTGYFEFFGGKVGGRDCHPILIIIPKQNTNK